MKKSLKRPMIIGIVVVIAFAIAVVAGLHVATRALKGQVEQALGPDSEVAAIVVNWTSIEARGVRIRAPKGWPAEDALRAERIVVSPDLLGLFSARLHVPRIVVDKAYLSVLRSRDGKLRLLPGLLERSKAADAATASAPGPAFTIGTIELHHGVLDFFDATVRTPAHRTRLEQLHAKVEDLLFPGLSGRTAIQLDGTVQGVQRNGRLSINGWAELASRNSEIVTKLQGVDLVALQPYLIKASETGVRQGALDLTMKSVVSDNRLRAPGTVTLTGLELAPASGGLGTFMGVPRQAVIAALKNRKNQISVDFTLEGDLNDPKFSLNESFMKHIGTSVAETLGISIEGLARGAAGGLGGMMKKLFGK
jgi:uncharacterized protein involved in outer membrane biogenesis